MSEICIYIPMPQYLREWFVNERGGILPIRLMRGSLESHILELFLRPLRQGESPSPASSDTIPVIIPEFKLKKPESANHLPPSATEAFVRTVRQRFDMELFRDLSKFHASARDRKDLIYAWMDAHNISDIEENFFAIEKRYTRLINRYNHAKAQNAYRRRHTEKSL